MNSLFLYFYDNRGKQIFRAIEATCLIFSLTGLFVVHAEEGLSDTQAQLDRVTKIVEQIESNLAKNIKNQDLVRKEMDQLERELGKLHAQIKATENSISQGQKREKQLQNEKARLDQDLADQGILFKQLVRVAYGAQDQSKWKILLSQNSIQHAGRNALMYDYIHKARAEQLVHLSDLALALRTNQTELQQQQEMLQKLLKKQTNEQVVLNKVRIRKETAKKELEQLIDKDKDTLKVEQDNKAKLQKLLKKLNIKKSRGQFAENAGKLHWPAKGKLKRRFGEHRSGGGELSWSGVLIQAARGSEIHAIFSGTVVFSDWFDHYGWLTIIDHGSDYMSLYAHAEGLYKNVGDYVTQGELIAVVGDSGDADQAGLYFEIRRQGAPVDPAGWCVYPKMAYSP